MSKNTSVVIWDYHDEWLDKKNVNVSKVLRDELDLLMQEMGSDPEKWEERYGR